jgi:hypothetical protein
MVQVIQAYLQEKFALHKSQEEKFFTEWADNSSPISELEV